MSNRVQLHYSRSQALLWKFFLYQIITIAIVSIFAESFIDITTFCRCTSLVALFAKKTLGLCKH